MTRLAVNAATRFAVYVATTGGAVQVERITRENGLLRSVVCLGRQTTKELPISDDYSALVKQPTGVIERDFGPYEEGAFRLDVSDRVGPGLSWQLGVYVAHAIEASGRHRLAGPGDIPDRVLWLTGKVDHDLSVGAVEDLAEKLHRSQDAFDHWQKAGIPVTLFVPSGKNHEEAKRAIGNGGRDLVAVANTGDVLEGLVPARGSRPQAGKGGTRRWFPVLATGAVLAAAALVALTPWHEAETDREERLEQAGGPVGPQVALSVLERRAPAGKSCPAVHMATVGAVLQAVAPAGPGRLTSSRPEGLCGLAFVVEVPARALFVAAFVRLESGALIEAAARPAALGGAAAVSGRFAWTADLPLRISEPVAYRLVALAAGRAVADDLAWLRAQADWPAPEALSQRGLTVISLSHRIEP